MTILTRRLAGRLPRGLIAAGLLALPVACMAAPEPQAPQPATAPDTMAVIPPSASQGAAAPAVAPAELKPLKIEPVKGYVGDRFTIGAEALAPNQQVDLVWATFDGDYEVKVMPETIEYYDRQFKSKKVPLGKATTDAQGRLNASFTVPDDYGELHDIFAAVDGQEVARGGYRVLPQFTMTPTEGPVGTPITIKAKGIGVKVWENTWEIMYDNRYSGYVTGLTTRGSAEAMIRAAGPAGKHVVQAWHGGQAVPYLNWEQSPQAHIPIFTFTFNVTGDSGPPPLTLDWPDRAPVSVDLPQARTTSSTGGGSASAAVTALVTPAAGPVLSNATLRAANLPPNTPVEIFFITARGSRTSGLGWGLTELPLARLTTNSAGAIEHPFQVPDDLGGWHTLKVVGDGKVLAEAPYLTQPSLVTVTPTRVKQGEEFQVHLKGIGWTELDNTVAVTYDNGYIGFACGFNSNGDVTINLLAAGGAGTHLIDVYPLVYQGHGKTPWLYDLPMLTALKDHPSLSLGYRLPIFRLAIEVVE